MRLSQIAALASEIFIGRERFATLLLIRLTETVILWISDDQTFWEEIEQGAKPLGPFGLQQVKYLSHLIIFNTCFNDDWIFVVAVLLRYGIRDAICIPRPFLVSKSPASS